VAVLLTTVWYSQNHKPHSEEYNKVRADWEKCVDHALAANPQLGIDACNKHWSDQINRSGGGGA
jgi:hypothetical protein